MYFSINKETIHEVRLKNTGVKNRVRVVIYYIIIVGLKLFSNIQGPIKVFQVSADQQPKPKIINFVIGA